MDELFKKERSELVTARMELCEAAIEINGQKLEPDETKGYVQFNIGQGLQVTEDGQLVGINAYRSSIHPGTVANSYQSMLHQVFNRGHEMKAHDPENISRDHIVGAIVGVEFPKSPMRGWGLKSMNGGVNPIIRAAAVIHKKAEGVGKILSEHLTGKHNWTVSMEAKYNMLDSGFVVGQRGDAKKKQEEMLAQLTPEEFSSLGLGYIPIEAAPDELLECYNMDKSLVDKPWGNLPVYLMKGGINGRIHFGGVGWVRYGAEREAEITQLLASDPNAAGAEGIEAMLEVSKNIFINLKKIVDSPA
jgi:hypothetical protein